MSNNKHLNPLDPKPLCVHHADFRRNCEIAINQLNHGILQVDFRYHVPASDHPRNPQGYSYYSQFVGSVFISKRLDLRIIKVIQTNDDHLEIRHFLGFKATDIRIFQHAYSTDSYDRILFRHRFNNAPHKAHMLFVLATSFRDNEQQFREAINKWRIAHPNG